ncbi:MAG: hypothetical protein V2I97_12840 [Desulfococcaceae bacterium]|jgi:hypothetical protein|nr:hypothetical protein [Desulfococcaceae bacterium]
MVSVQVVRQSSGKPAEGKKVVLSFDGLSRGVTGHEYTNRNGEAHFGANPGSGKVIVDGSTVYNGRIAGRVVVYV